MCLAAYVPNKVRPKVEYMKQAWEKNPDGAGYAFIRNGEIDCEWFFKQDFSDFWSSLESDMNEHGETSPFLIHFRKASAGSVSASNVHPFTAWSGGKEEEKTVIAAVVHNGTISRLKLKSEDESDTKKMVARYFDGLTTEIIDSQPFRWLLAQCVGASRIAYLSASGMVTLVNSKEWICDEGIYYSNKCYVPEKPKLLTASTETDSVPWIPSQPPVSDMESVSRYLADKGHHSASNECDICRHQIDTGRRVNYMEGAGSYTVRVCSFCYELPKHMRVHRVHQSDQFAAVLGILVKCANCGEHFWSCMKRCPACRSAAKYEHEIITPEDSAWPTCNTCHSPITSCEEDIVSYNLQGKCMSCATNSFGGL